MSWKQVWERKGQKAIDCDRPILPQILMTSGYDHGPSQLLIEEWEEYVARIQTQFSLIAGMKVCDIGCNSGPLLYPLYKSGISVSGIDYAESAIEIARKIMPEGNFHVGSADILPFDTSSVDVVFSSGVFHYFPNLMYAEHVLSEMWRVSQGTIVVLDVPDDAKRESAETFRRGHYTPAEYERLYAQHPHLYYEKIWFEQWATMRNLSVSIIDQQYEHYPNAPYRFNAIITT